MDHLQNTNFHNVLGIHLGIRSLWIWVWESNLLQFTNFFVIFKLIFQKFHHFHNVIITFFKDIYRELHWKGEIFLPWTLFVNFWLSNMAPGSKIDSFQFLLKFMWAVTWRLLKIQSWNFQDFYILLMQTSGPNIIKIVKVTWGPLVKLIWIDPIRLFRMQQNKENKQKYKGCHSVWTSSSKHYFELLPFFI